MLDLFALAHKFSSSPNQSQEKENSAMPNVYVEPQPAGRPEGSAITHYVLEYSHGLRATATNYKTQEEAISDAKKIGHQPLVARVRDTDKGNPDHWRHA